MFARLLVRGVGGWWRMTALSCTCLAPCPFPVLAEYIACPWPSPLLASLPESALPCMPGPPCPASPTPCDACQLLMSPHLWPALPVLSCMLPAFSHPLLTSPVARLAHSPISHLIAACPAHCLYCPFGLCITHISTRSHVFTSFPIRT